MHSRILLIDDDHDIRCGSEIRFRRAGYEFSPAKNGETGVRIASSLHPSVIVLDMKMPGMTGIDVLRKLKAQKTTRDIPVLVLSASLGDEQAALDAGARFFMKKPYDGKELLAIVATLIRSNEADPVTKDVQSLNCETSS